MVDMKHKAPAGASPDAHSAITSNLQLRVSVQVHACSTCMHTHLWRRPPCCSGSHSAATVMSPWGVAWVPRPHRPARPELARIQSFSRKIPIRSPLEMTRDGTPLMPLTTQLPLLNLRRESIARRVAMYGHACVSCMQEYSGTRHCVVSLLQEHCEKCWPTVGEDVRDGVDVFSTILHCSFGGFSLLVVKKGGMHVC